MHNNDHSLLSRVFQMVTFKIVAALCLVKVFVKRPMWLFVLDKHMGVLLLHHLLHLTFSTHWSCEHCYIVTLYQELGLHKLMINHSLNHNKLH